MIILEMVWEICLEMLWKNLDSFLFLLVSGNDMQCSWHQHSSVRGTSPWKSVFPFLFGEHLVTHVRIDEDFAKKAFIRGHIRFLTVTNENFPLTLQLYRLIFNKQSSWIQCKLSAFTKIKLYPSSFLCSFIWASGEGEWGVACCSGGCTAQTAGTAPEWPGWAGAEAAGLLPGWEGQSSPCLPGRGRQVQNCHAAAGLSLQHLLNLILGNFKVIYSLRYLVVNFI